MSLAQTPLHLAVINFKGIDYIERQMLNQNNHVNTRDIYGKTPIFYAIDNRRFTSLYDDENENIKIPNEYQKEKIVELLIQNGADINIMNFNGKYPLSYAVKNCHLGITNLLLTNGASCQEHSFELLHLAIRERSLQIVQTLLRHASAYTMALLSVVNLNLYFPISDSHTKTLLEVSKLFIKSGADVSTSNFDGETLLHMFARAGSVEMTEFLIYWGAEVNCTSKRGQSPLYLAASEGHVNIVTILSNYGADINLIPRNVTERVYEILIDHVMKLETAELYVKRKILRRISMIHDMIHAYDTSMLLTEIEKMKTTVIADSDISYYDILMAYDDSHATPRPKHFAISAHTLQYFLRRKAVVDFLRRETYKTEFRNYGSIIHARVWKHLYRQELIIEGCQMFYLISRVNNLPILLEDCMEKIFSNLSLNHLRLFIFATKS